MKRLARWALLGVLTTLARAVIRRYRPQVVMVTGSVGKTSTKDAVTLALSAKFRVRGSEKSLNSEFGVPFTILGIANPWRSPVAWMGLVLRALRLLALPNRYPELLALEVGADHPGDLARILAIAKPDCVVVTALPETPVHVEFYASPEAVREEEFSPALALKEGAPLVISADDPYARALSARTKARITTFGLDEGASVRLSDIHFWQEGGRVLGMQGHLGGEVEVQVEGAVGKTQLLPLAAAAAAAGAYGISLREAVEALASYQAPAGRGRLFAGVHGSTLVDDTYNASPAAVEEALENLKAFPGASRRVAVLGDMLELGRYSAALHARIGERARSAADLLITVGPEAKGMGGSEHFGDSSAAAVALPSLIKEGDVVLIKGSQSIRMERVVAALLADPLDRANLVRQEPAWLRR